MFLWRAACAWVVSCWLAPGLALAQSGDAESAKVLFEQGRDAMKAKDYPRACEAFRQSYLLAGTGGSLLNWADCEEARGRVGTSLRLWRAAEAKVVGDAERAAFARERIAALLPRAPTVQFQLVVPGVDPRVTVEGMEVDESLPVPIDPGPNQITVQAQGFQSESHTVRGELGQVATLRILTAREVGAPSQVPAPPPAAGPEAPPPSSDGNTALWVGGWVSVAAGGAGAILFAVTAGVVTDKCGGLGDSTCPAEEESSVQTLNALNLAGLITGVVGLGVGIPLLVVGSSSGEAPAAAAQLRVGPLGAAIEGTF